MLQAEAAQGTACRGMEKTTGTRAVMGWAEGDAVLPGFNWEFPCNTIGTRNPSPPALHRGEVMGTFCLSGSLSAPTVCQAQQQGWGHGWTRQTHPTLGRNNPAKCGKQCGKESSGTGQNRNVCRKRP